MACDEGVRLDEFARGTTPEGVLRCKGVDLSGWRVFVTFEQGAHELTVDDVTVEPAEWGSLVRYVLSQEDTLGFKEGYVSVQVRAVKGARAIASYKSQVNVLGVLMDGVISDG